MENIFETDLISTFKFENIQNKFWGIKVPVQNVFGFQTIYAIKLEDNFFRIHDGGETLGSALQSQNTFSKEFESKLFETCKTRKVSKNGNVLFIDATAQQFKNAFFDFYACITILHS